MFAPPRPRTSRALSRAPEEGRMGFVTGASGEAITLGRLLFVFVQVGR